jgi:EAL domain-containing protein (putative c-di-GMP-specific phosphodiesterase class I)
MSYLRRYAIDKLKIDKSFVAELGTSRDADAIVRAMIGLARSLRLQVTAEGVETVAQRDHLTAIGCQELQGYLLSRPIPEAELIELLARPPQPPARPRPVQRQTNPKASDPTA